MQLYSTSDELDKYYTTLVAIVHSFHYSKASVFLDHCEIKTAMHSSTTKTLCMHVYNCIAIYIKSSCVCSFLMTHEGFKTC